jgi:hypothetical protein
MADRAYLEALTKRLADEGKLIEAGWVEMRLAVVPLNAPPPQLRDMRLAYMAGAQHLWSSIITMLEPGAEPTDVEMRRMALISDELEVFYNEIKLAAAETKGSA